MLHWETCHLSENRYIDNYATDVAGVWTCSGQAPHGPYAYNICVTDVQFECSEDTTALSKIMTVSITTWFMILMGMFVDTDLIRWDNLREIRIALSTQIFLNPILLVGVTYLFGLREETQVAAIVMAISPGGQGSNMLTVIAGGMPDLSIFITCCSVTTCLVSYPLYLTVGISALGLGGNTSFVWQVPIIVIGLMVFTVLLGFALRKSVGASSKELRMNPVFLGVVYITIAIATLTVCLVSYLSWLSPVNNFYIRQMTWKGWVCAATQNACGLLLGYTVSVAAGLQTIFHRTIAFEVGAQNIMFAFSVISFSLPLDRHGLYFGYLFQYAMTSIAINYTLAFGFRFLAPLSENDRDVWRPNEEAIEDQVEVAVTPLTDGKEAAGHIRTESSITTAVSLQDVRRDIKIRPCHESMVCDTGGSSGDGSNAAAQGFGHEL